MSDLSFDEAKEQLDIEFFLELESEPFKVTRGVNGTQLNVKNCPMPNCKDNRWRTYFGLDTGRGNCFVCGQAFNTLSFVHNYYSHGDNEWRATMVAVKKILEQQGWRPKRVAAVAVTVGDVVLPMSDALPRADGTSLDYLTERGFGPEICTYLGLRHCQFGWWFYLNDEGKKTPQDFSRRVIIPVYDLDGTLKTFQGRDLTGLSDRKYLFPKELPGTGRYLLNGHNVVATDHVVMCEGAFDVAAVKIALDEDPSLRNVVPIGSFGKHLSYGSDTGDDQLGRFRALRGRGVGFVTIMWDGEEKALVAALDAARRLTGLGLKARIALLPFDKDPNEVDGSVVRAAFHAARLWTPALDIQWRLLNPYRDRGKHMPR